MPESVWDYPRPPRVEPTPRRIQVVFRGVIIADTRDALRVLETSHPPAYYLPRDHVRMQFLQATPHTTWCEFKGEAEYYDVVLSEWRSARAAWSYRVPSPGYEALAGRVAFYPSRVDRCLVDGEEARAQPGDFYGGWITRDVQGPFKGGPGTQGW